MDAVTLYRCPRCRKLFSTAKGARQHVRDKHSIGSPCAPVATIMFATPVGYDSGWRAPEGPA